MLKNTLTKSAGIYTIANILNAAIPFLLLPILTHYLSKADYGILTNFMVLFYFVMPFITFGTEGAVTRQYIDKEKVNFSQYFSNILIIIALGTILVSLIFLVFSKVISRYTGVPQNKIYLVVIIAFFTGLINIILAVWRAQFKALKYSILRISKTIMELGLSIILIIFVSATWESRINGLAFAVIISGLIAIFFMFNEKLINLKFNKNYISDALKFGLPLIPHTIGAVLINMSDKLFITNMIGIDETGLYAAGYQIAAVILILQDSFNQAFAPWLYTKLKENNYSTKRKIVKFTYAYDLTILILAILLALTSPFIVKIFLGKNFYNAQKFILWIALAFAFNGMYKMVVNYLFYIKDTKAIAPITISVAVLNLILNYFLIKINGAVGAAQATATSFLVLFLSMWIVSAKKYKMPWLLRH